MKKLIEVFVKQGLPLLSLQQTEEYIEEWFNTPNEYQGIVLPYLINQKLQRNEQEY